MRRGCRFWENYLRRYSIGWEIEKIVKRKGIHPNRTKYNYYKEDCKKKINKKGSLLKERASQEGKMKI